MTPTAAGDGSAPAPDGEDCDEDEDTSDDYYYDSSTGPLKVSVQEENVEGGEDNAMPLMTIPEGENWLNPGYEE